MPNLPAETLTIEGPDAIAFAQAQFTSDVLHLAADTWQWSAWLNPKGRVRALGHLLWWGEQQLRFVLRGGSAAAMVQALAPYVLRKRVTLTAAAPAMLVDAPPLPVGTAQRDGGDTVLGLGDYAIRSTSRASGAGQAWRTSAIRCGHPWLPASTLEQLLAASLRLQELGAVDLGKGCFPGQEIVARLHYRGGCKQHLRRVESVAPLPAGGALRVDGADAGTVLDSVGEGTATRALAVVRDTMPQGPLVVTIDDRTYKISTFIDLQ